MRLLESMGLWLVVVTMLVSVAAAQSPPVPSDIPASRYTPEAIAEIRAKAEAGSPQAQVVLGQAYEEGNGVPKNEVTAAKWYRKAAEQGNAEGQNDLGIMYRMGAGVDQDKAEAVRWYQKAAKQGYANAMFNIGAAQYNGDGVPVNSALAFAWFSLAADAGSDSAKNALDRLSQEIPREQMPLSHFLIGQMLEAGDQVKQDLPQAMRWYRRAADEGNGAAQWRLADLNYRGVAVPKDLAEAERWREKALKQDNGPLKVEYGNMLRTGNGVGQDLRAAAEMYRRAAEADRWPSGMLNLGLMYANAQGVQKDVTVAYVWIAGAALHGHGDVQHTAARVLKLLEGSMSTEEIKKARKESKKKWNMIFEDEGKKR